MEARLAIAKIGQMQVNRERDRHTRFRPGYKYDFHNAKLLSKVYK